MVEQKAKLRDGKPSFQSAPLEDSATTDNPAMGKTAVGLLSQFTGAIEMRPFGKYRVVEQANDPDVRNGVETIEKAKFAQLERTWDALQNGSGNVRFDGGMTSWQRTTLLQTFATALGQRIVGRALVMYAVWDGPPILIKIGEGAGGEDPEDAKQKPVTIPSRTLNNVSIPVYRDRSTLYETTGNFAAVLKLDHILGHEISHVFSDEYNLERRRWGGGLKLDRAYGSLHERIAITNFENLIHTEDKTPLNRGHRGADYIKIPLDDRERQLLRSIASASAAKSMSGVEERLASDDKQIIALAEKLGALAQDPDISPAGRELCRKGALRLQLLTSSGSSVFQRGSGLDHLDKLLEALTFDLESLNGYLPPTYPDFQAIDHEELQRRP